MLETIITFIELNFIYISVISIIVFLILFIFSFFFIRSKFKMIMAFFGTKQFDILTYYNHDTLKDSKNFVFRLFNKNIHDLRVSSFGFEFQGQTLDLVSHYKKNEQIPDHKDILIQPRDYITLEFELDILKKYIDTINKDSVIISKISAYVIDSLGLKTRKNVRHIKKQLNLILQDESTKKRRDLRFAKATKQLNTIDAKRQQSTSKIKNTYYQLLTAYYSYKKNKSNPS